MAADSNCRRLSSTRPGRDNSVAGQTWYWRSVRRKTERRRLEHLHHGGLHEVAEQVARQADELQRGLHGPPEGHEGTRWAELHRQLEEMRRELHELRKIVDDLRTSR